MSRSVGLEGGDAQTADATAGGGNGAVSSQRSRARSMRSPTLRGVSYVLVCIEDGGQVLATAGADCTEPMVLRSVLG